MACKTPMNARSAKNLITTASNKFLRRLKNTYRELPPERIEAILEENSRDFNPISVGL